MFKLIVLSVVLAVVAAAPKPGYLHAAPYVHTAQVAIPVAVSHTSRTEIHSNPIIATYAAAPLVVAAPLVTSHAVVPAPVIVKSSYGYGLVGGHGYGYEHGHHAW